MAEKMTLDYNQPMLDTSTKEGAIVCGIHTSYTLRNDAKHILFSLSRYKFCAKMLSGSEYILEAGCGDGLGTGILLQEVGKVYAVDVEEAVIRDNEKRNEYTDKLQYACIDALQESIKTENEFDAVISLDVIEHIEKEKEHTFLNNIFANLKKNGVAIIGTPNISAEKYASPLSKAGHINLKSHDELKKLMLTYFNNVFMFSMNDEVLHTGYQQMGHYIIALCAGYKGSD